MPVGYGRSYACWMPAGVQIGSYTNFMYVLPAGMASICNWVGLGELPGTQTWFTPDSLVSFTKHEINKYWDACDMHAYMRAGRGICVLRTGVR